ncbi:synsav [Mycena capillaripes]|nr:synsav [Mycena capillaripes]
MSEQVDWGKKLSGDWYNQLGSKMSLHADENGGLCGKYNSAVGKAEDFYILTGRFDACPSSDEGVSVGWVVTYRNRKLNANSTATWSGQYFDSGDERILTHWLLTSSTAPKSVWKSTNLGHDTFTRKKPSAAQIAQVPERAKL